MDASKIGFFIHFVDQYEGLKNNRLNLWLTDEKKKKNLRK